MIYIIYMARPFTQVYDIHNTHVYTCMYMCTYIPLYVLCMSYTWVTYVCIHMICVHAGAVQGTAHGL